MRHFYFFLFLLSRKARNATIKLPKAMSKLKIPIITEIISKAVIITHLPSYVIQRTGVDIGRLPPCHGHSNACFHAYLEYHISHVYSIANRIFVRFIFIIFNTQKPPKAYTPGGLPSLISPKYISRIHLVRHIIQTRIIPVRNNCLRLCLELF